MERLTQQDLAVVLAEKSGISKKEAQQFVAALFDVVQSGLQSDSVVKVKGLGTFKMIDVESRESVNVNTGERVLIAGHPKITFIPDATMKELVNKPFSGFETVALNDGVNFDDMSELPLAELTDDDALAEEETEVEEQVTTVEPVAEEEEQPIVEPVADEAEEEQPVTVEEEPSVVEENPPVVKEETPVVEEKAPVVEVQEPVEETHEKPYRHSRRRRKSRRWLWPVVCVAGCVLSFFCGYHYYKMSHQPIEVMAELSDATTGLEELQVEEPVPVVTDTVTTVADSMQTEPEKLEAVVEQADADSVDYRKYEAMDGRVRTGAYRIVGTDQVITVGQGETLLRIAKRTMGADMVCYLEVFNDMMSPTAQLEPGTQVKIPKLELKKTKKKNIKKNKK